MYAESPGGLFMKQTSSIGKLARASAGAAFGLWCGVLALNVISAELPFGVAQLSTPLSSFMTLIAPQGWSFFTRTPRSATFVYYQGGSGRETTRIDHPNRSIRKLLGLRRVANRQENVLSARASRIAQPQWRSCGQWSAEQCAARVLHARAVSDCVDTVVVRRAPTSWASARHTAKLWDSLSIANLGSPC